ncbi:hypothetical protein GCM10011581_45500 [Saccharopolyspora subtropica]|uniref:Mycofactocin n=1 Tax=Saccharopolyspora thermophila TaxID=89367 RepID=A0A917K7A3_9PSEU|nr:mycofactocin precursor MftA [Saccharopolyspora subtropica]GGJ03300.1 hypothetical protein GCM10011581_45500 [Saccharopolyspora subtropica]
MEQQISTEAAQAAEFPASGAAAGDVVEEMLVEDVSIDGMCGVY